MLVAAGMRVHSDLLEAEIYEHISTRVPELMLDHDTKREARARATISAVVGYCLDTIQPEPASLTWGLPETALERARAAAREGASIGPLLRAIEAGRGPFVALLIAEAQRLPLPALVREHLRETYSGLLGDILAVVEREYERERFAQLSDGTPCNLTAVPVLTRREREVVELLLAGRSYKEIARALCVTTDTVHTHASHVYRKLGIRGRDELACQRR